MRKKKHRGLFFNIELKPYRYGLVVSIGQTNEEVDRAMKRLDKAHGIERRVEVMNALETPGPGFCVVWEADSFMCIRSMPIHVQDQGVVIHELVHVVQHCMNSRGMKMSGRTSQEAFCYLIEEAWNEIMGRVARHIK
jgi:hypothetical protein